jgi:flagellar biogenesis protein FliO
MSSRSVKIAIPFTAMRRHSFFGTWTGLLLFCTQSASAQTLGRAADGDISLWRVASALLLCIVVAVVAAFVLKARMGNANTFQFLAKRSRRLQLVETLRFGQQSVLSIVICDGQEMLVLTTGQAVQLMQRLPLGSEAALPQPEELP